MPDVVLDKAKQALAAFARGIFQRLDYYAMYPCAVVSQNGDGSLEMRPDDPRLPTSFSHIPLRLGIPGCVVTLGTPTRALIGWYGGDPTKPYAALFELSNVTEIDLNASTIKLNGGTNGVARNTDTVSAAATMSTWISAVTTGLNGLAPGSCVLPTDFGKISSGSTTVKSG